MITREKAHETLRAEIEHDCPVAGRVRVGDLMSGDSPAAPSLDFYGADRIEPKCHWIGYIRSGCGPEIAPSLVVVISKHDGRIVYQGVIHDED